jgi:hypothetical protein
VSARSHFPGDPLFVAKEFKFLEVKRLVEYDFCLNTVMTRSHVLLFTLLFVPFSLHASQKTEFLPHTKQTCASRSANGRELQIQYRGFHWRNRETDVYTGAVAYYVPGSGEFLWWGAGFTTKEAYLKNIGNNDETFCTSKRHDIVLVDDGELVIFYAENGGIHIFHSNLKFPSIEKGWEYVAEHPDETSSWGGGKWLQEVSLDKELGYDFFRTERLRLSAQPYLYDSLAGVTKVGSTWQVEIKGADQPNRAFVVLDRAFNLVKVTTNPAPK